MTDEVKPRKPPRLPVRVTRDISGDVLDPDEVFVPPPPDTDRSGFIPKPPKAEEPFRLVTPPRRADLGEQIADVLKTQRQMALQLDGYGSALNQRFDLFHEELAIVRHDQARLVELVEKDHAPRIDAVEKTVQQKAKGFALKGGKYAAYLTAGSVLARLVAKAYPQFGDAIESFLGALGL
jgi:hypothetical protein